MSDCARAKGFVAGVVLLLMATCSLARAAYRPLPADLVRLLASTVAISVEFACDGKQGRTTGTAFKISDQGYFLTAAHLFPECDQRTLVIEGYTQLPFTKKSGPFPFELIHEDHAWKHDVAVLKEQGMLTGPPILMDDHSPSLGADVMIIGYPGGKSIQHILGIIGGAGDNGTFQVTGTYIRSGYSGGPVLSSPSGRAIGILRAGDPVVRAGPEALAAGDPLFVPIGSIVNSLPDEIVAAWRDQGSSRPMPPPALGIKGGSGYQTVYVNEERLRPEPYTDGWGDHEDIVIHAQNGFHITDAMFDPISTSGAQHAVEISPDKRKASLRYSLVGQPDPQGYRSWLAGNFTVKENSIAD